MAAAYDGSGRTWVAGRGTAARFVIVAGTGMGSSGTGRPHVPRARRAGLG